MTRPGWNDYFMNMAFLASTRATCDRKHVGAILALQNRVVATGYNGSPSGLPHCDDVGHLLKNIEGRDSCIRTLHAESNAIDNAGPKAANCALYTTVIPCYDCAKRIINAGICAVYYHEYYESRSTELVVELFDSAELPIIHWNEGLIIDINELVPMDED